MVGGSPLLGTALRSPTFFLWKSNSNPDVVEPTIRVRANFLQEAGQEREGMVE